MRRTLYFLIFLHFYCVSAIAQTSNNGIADEIYQRAETYYNDGQYAQAADLLERLNVLKIPADFKSLHLKIKALSNVYAKEARYVGMLESSLPAFFELTNSTSAPAQKVREIEDIRVRFENYKTLEKDALDKARTGTVQDKQEYVRNYPGSPYAEELKSLIAEENVYDKSIKIKKLEMQLWDLNRLRKKKNRLANVLGAGLFTLGLCSAIVGGVGIASYDPESDDNVMSKKDSWVLIGAGAGPMVAGLAILIPATNAKLKIEKKIKSLEQDIVNEKKTVVYMSPYSKFELGGSFGLRFAMQF